MNWMATGGLWQLCCTGSDETYVRSLLSRSVELSLTSHSTHNRSFRGRIFPGNQLHWYWSQKHALSNNKKNLKLQLSPGLVASYDIQPGNGVGLFWDTTTHTPDPLLLAVLELYWWQLLNWQFSQWKSYWLCVLPFLTTRELREAAWYIISFVSVCMPVRQ